VTAFPAPEGGALIRVLVVDDDARVRTALRETFALENDMSLVGDAHDAAAALAMAAATDPDVALVDVLLPDDGTGLALVGALSRRPGCGVVAMSVRSALREGALTAGAVAFVEKGDDIDVLLDSVRRACEQTKDATDNGV
jgi:DNA-binding NarL/FixJ family response regulator